MAGDYKISFCILHHNRLGCLQKCVESIRDYCSEPYEILILNQGVETPEIMSYLRFLETRRVKVVYSKINVGCPAGRKALIKMAEGDYICTLDDDIYLTQDSIQKAMEVFKKVSSIGIIGWPQYKPNGELMNTSGKQIKFSYGLRYGVINLVKEEPYNFISGGCQIFRKELKEVFEWDDRYKMGFGDLDKALQVIQEGSWTSYVISDSSVIHDHSSDKNDYVRERYDYKVFASSYALFQEKWGLRLDWKKHLMYKYAFFLVPNSWIRFITNQLK